MAIKKSIRQFARTIATAGVLTALSCTSSFASTAGAVEGQVMVVSGGIDQDGPKFNSGLAHFTAGTGPVDTMERLESKRKGSSFDSRTFLDFGINNSDKFGLSASEKKLTYNYGPDDKEYVWMWSGALNQDATRVFSPIGSSASMHAITEDWFSDDSKIDKDDEFDSVYIDYAAKIYGAKQAANSQATIVAGFFSGSMPGTHTSLDYWNYNVVPRTNVNIFPDSFDDVVYVEKQDYPKLCPWYQEYTWTAGRNTWPRGKTSDERKALTEKAQNIFNQYGKSNYMNAKYVNDVWKSLTGEKHAFLDHDLYRLTGNYSDSYLSRYGGQWIQNARYDSGVLGNTGDILSTTRLPSQATRELYDDEYYYTSKSGKDSVRHNKYYEVELVTEEQTYSTWQISSDAKTWMTVVSNDKGSKTFRYDALKDEVIISSKTYPVKDFIPDHKPTFFLRRIATCGNTFWSGSQTSPAIRVRPFLTLDGLDVFTNKEVVEGGYLDPKDVTVIAHYNTGDVVMSGKGSYIKYPGETNLRITIVGTNYVYYEYTDPTLGDVVKGYFQVKGIEKTPVSVTAEYVGPAVVEKKDYNPNYLHVNVTFNNGSTDTFTAESSNVGTYKTKFYGRGDMDSNGVLNTSDADLLKSAIGGAVMTSEQKIQADVNQDGKITTDDLTKLNAYTSKQVIQIGSNTFYAAFAKLKMKDGSPVYARFTVNGTKRSPYSVSVVQNPKKTMYIEGEDFDPTDMVLKVLYDNGDSIFVTYKSSTDKFPEVTLGDADHSPKNMSAELVALPIYYTENGVTVKTELKLDVSLTTLTSIKVTRPPDTTIYYSGETFKTTGMDVTAYYDEDVEGHIPTEVLLTSSEYGLSNYKKMKDGELNIAFLLDDPAQVSGASGEYLLVAKNLLADNQSYEDQASGTYSYKSGTSFEGTVCGNHLVKISYTNRGITKYAYQPLWVYGKRPTSLTIVSMPYATEYISGQDFNQAGLILRVSYSDGSSNYLYPKTESKNGYEIVGGTGLTSDMGFVIAQYTENQKTLQVEVPITVIDPEIDGITASYLGPSVYVGEQYQPKDVQIVVSYSNGNVKSFRANETNGDGTQKVKLVIPAEDGTVDPTVASDYKVYKAGVNVYAACYSGFTDDFEVQGVANPDQLDFSGSIAKSKRMYDTWAENFTATKIRSVADYINGKVDLTDVQTVDEYHVVNRQTSTDTRTSLSAEEGTGQGINLDSGMASGTVVSPLLSFLREGAWRQPETVIGISYRGRTKGFLYPETPNPAFTPKYDGDLTYIVKHQQVYNTPKEELQSYNEEGWSDWVGNSDTIGTVMADRVAYNYTGTDGNTVSETMILDRMKIKLTNIPADSAPQLNVTVRDSRGVEKEFKNIQETDTILDPCQIKMELGGTVTVIDNYGQAVNKPFGDVYKIFYKTTTDDATGWSAEGEWAGYEGVNMQCLEIDLMLKETDFNTGTITNAPIINRQPKNVSVRIGGNATFSVSAVGNDLFYQWYCNGTAIAGANGQVYATPELKLSDNGNIYYCTITAENGTGLQTKSSSVTVTVRDVAPVLTADLPETLTGKVGDVMEFSISAYCLDPDALHYEWQITQNGNYVPLAGGDQDKLSVKITADMHGEYIRCHITNSQGTCNSNPMRVSCISAPVVTITSSEPSAYISNAQSNMITFSAVAVSDAAGAKEYSWAFDGITKGSATKDSTTWIPTTNGTHTVTCTVTDALGNKGTGTYIVYVGEKPKVSLSVSQKKETDGTTTITVRTSLTSHDAANLKFQWTYDQLGIASNTNITESADHRTLTIRKAAKGNHAVNLTITDGFGSASALQAIVVQ